MRALEFFANEIKARRWTMDRPWHAVFWFGLFYGWLSDFGRSLARPLLWWAASVAVFARLYLEAHLNRAQQPGSCVVGPGEPWTAALELSLRKGLLFIGLGPNDRPNRLYGCLYDTVPDHVAFLGLGQLLFSAVLIFLILLALRNHFRIK